MIGFKSFNLYFLFTGIFLLIGSFSIASAEVIVNPLHVSQKHFVDQNLWGQGRPNAEINGNWHENPSQNIYFAQSRMITHWSDANAACPRDSWVCTGEERGTTVIDVTSNLYQCDGSIDVNIDSLAWVAEAQFLWGRAVKENGQWCPLNVCYMVPVWCCKN
jgi:hypothetical protein